MSVELVALLNQAGCGLQVTGVTDQGQSGAAFVRWPDGRASVVTTAFASLVRMRQTASILAELQAAGIPVPLHEYLLDVGDGRVAVIQQLMPGQTVTSVDVAHIDAMVAVNDQFAHLLTRRPDVPAPALSLGRPTDPVPTLLIEQQGARARRLLDRIRATAADPSEDVVGDDLVHVDLTVPNMLFDDTGRITGVIDWNYGIARGDRHYGLVKLMHHLSFDAASDQRTNDAVISRVEQVVADRVALPTLNRYWAHHSLTMMDASLRWGTHEAFATYLQLGTARLD